MIFLLVRRARAADQGGTPAMREPIEFVAPLPADISVVLEELRQP